VTYAFARLGVADALQPTGSSKTCRELAAALEVRESQIGGKHRCLGAQLKKNGKETWKVRKVFRSQHCLIGKFEEFERTHPHLGLCLRTI